MVCPHPPWPITPRGEAVRALTYFSISERSSRRAPGVTTRRSFRRRRTTSGGTAFRVAAGRLGRPESSPTTDPPALVFVARGVVAVWDEEVVWRVVVRVVVRATDWATGLLETRTADFFSFASGSALS